MNEPRNHRHPAERLGASAWAEARNEEFDVAIVRIIDGEDAAGEWERFQLAADAQPSLWRELAIGQRDERLLHQAVADRIDGRVAGHLVGEADGPFQHCVQGAIGDAADEAWPSEERSIPLRPSAASAARAGARLGWAMAACIAGAWVISAGVSSRQRVSTTGPEALAYQSPSPVPSPVPLANPTTQASGIQPAAFLSPHQALDAYLELGQKSGAVVGELPGKPIIERRALEDGAGYEVIFVRQIVERGRVPAMYSFEPSNEFGTPVPMPVKDAPKRRDPL